MKLAITLCLLVMLILGLSLFAPHTRISTAAQNRSSPARISVQLQCPEYSVSGRSPITLYADILGTNDPEVLSPITFKWQVSKGKLVQGQGTRSIVLDVFKNETTRVTEVKVQVEAEGGPPAMVFENSCDLRVDPNCTLAPIFDHYSSISLEEEHERLDRLAAHLKQGPNTIAYIVAYGGKSSCIYEPSWRAESARQYLISTHTLPSDRLVPVDGGYRELWAVDLFVEPAGGCGPLPNPGLITSKVRIQGQCANQ